MKDLQGREYLTKSQLHEGLRVQVDGDFTCIPKNAIRIVKLSDGGYWIACKTGKHYLDGQLAPRRSITLIGIYPDPIGR